MLPPPPVNIVIDSSATGSKGTSIIEHERKKEETTLFNEDGSMRLGGNYSPLHRDAPWKKAWSLAKDGDLWGQFQAFVKSKSPWAIKLTKVQGQTTREMVQNEKVKLGDKFGNDQADTAADKGSIEEQPKLYYLANVYSKRQKDYAKFMARIHRFLLKIKDAGRTKRAAKEREKDPFEKKESGGTLVSKRLAYVEE